MHEASIVQSLLDAVEREAAAHGASAVHRLHLSLGELSGVEPDLLATAYGLFRQVGICTGAELEIHPVAALWNCPRCGAEPAAGSALRCQSCALPARLVRGDEIVLDRIEMEVS